MINDIVELKVLFHLRDPPCWVRTFKSVHIQFGEMVPCMLILRRALTLEKKRERSASTTLLISLFKRHVLWKVIKITRHVSGFGGMVLCMTILQLLLPFFIHLVFPCHKIIMQLTANLIQLVRYHLHGVSWSFFFHVGRLCVYYTRVTCPDYVRKLQKGYEGLSQIWSVPQDGHNG